MNMVTALNTSALAHCSYNAANRKNQTCLSDPHGEMMSCTGFTGATAQAREVAAGYPQALAYTEVATTFGNNPVAAVPGWIDTVWHRIPLLDPWTADMGYGGASVFQLLVVYLVVGARPNYVVPFLCASVAYLIAVSAIHLLAPRLTPAGDLLPALSRDDADDAGR